MKAFTKLILTISLLCVGFSSVASATSTPVVLRITGSSAFRGAVTNAIANLLVAGTETAAYYNVSAAGSSLAGSNQQLFHGYLKTATSDYPVGTEIYVQTSWTGSLSGIIALTTGANTVNPFLSTSNPTSSFAAGTGNDSNSGTTGGEALGNGTNPAPVLDNPEQANMAMSDVFQSSTQYSTPALTTANAGGSSLPGVVGVVPFVFCSGVDAGTSITNINANQAHQLLAGGLALSQFTGVSSDDVTSVLPVGRDADSGTRFTTFAETGFNPVGGSTVEPQQYAVTTSGSSVNVDLYPAETLFGKSYAAGTQGYSSGSGVSTALQVSGTNGSNSDNPTLIIGYVGESDGSTAVKGGAHFLSFNGVSYGSISGSTVTYNRTLIEQGVYPLWGYEHAYYLTGSSVTGSNITTLGDAIATDIRSHDALIAGDLISNMVVSRQVEGGPITYVGAQN